MLNVNETYLNILEEQVTIASTPQNVASESEFIILMLPNGNIVRDVCQFHLFSYEKLLSLCVATDFIELDQQRKRHLLLTAVRSTFEHRKKCIKSLKHINCILLMHLFLAVCTSIQSFTESSRSNRRDRRSKRHSDIYGRWKIQLFPICSTHSRSHGKECHSCRPEWKWTCSEDFQQSTGRDQVITNFEKTNNKIFRSSMIGTAEAMHLGIK